MIRIAFFDIDGTLVPLGQHEISEDARLALDALRANGVKVFIASGRHKCVMDNLHGYPFDGYVCTNGTLIIVGNEVVHSHPISKDDAREIVRIAEENRIPCVAYLQDRIRINFQTEESLKIFNLLRIKPAEPGDLVNAVEEEPIFEFTPIIKEDKEALFNPYLKDTIFVRWHSDFVDLNPKGVSKADGLRQVMEYYGFAREESIAFGDGENDMQMLAYAGIGVAMGNGTEVTKAHADYVTLPDVEGGISAALRQFGMI